MISVPLGKGLEAMFYVLLLSLGKSLSQESGAGDGVKATLLCDIPALGAELSVEAIA